MQNRPDAGAPAESSDADLDTAVGVHDAALAARGLDIWVGAEPTFTRRFSEAPEWLSEALGGDKHAYALRMVAALRRQCPGCVILRTVGRQYASEEVPRWSVGILARRDGQPVWQGPSDPLDAPSVSPGAGQLELFWHEIERAIADRDWLCGRFLTAGELGRRLLIRLDEGAAWPVDPEDPRLGRPSVHTHKTPDDGLSDPLAEDGLMLLAIGTLALAPGVETPCVELPAFGRIDDFLACLSAIAEAAGVAGIEELVLQGYAPPVDASLAWTTVTPDPAVIEINLAPQPDIRRFLASMRGLFAVTQSLGLSPYRLQYNGTASDSGGGGQFTLGGPSPGDSPFFANPALLPRLVRYVNHHPALSYLFAPDYVGGASQSPRPDEGTRDAFRELAVALEQLHAEPQPSAGFLWASLAPFLADPSGNAHRSELNIEKLWNPYLPGRGCLGLVEFRAFRMPFSAERAAAIAGLLRAVAAMLADSDPCPVLRDWGDALHDRWALPFFLRQDLGRVFADLEAAGLGLGPAMQSILLDQPLRAVWRTVHAGCELSLESAVEFWPLVGDVASQESGGSRLVDSSTLRLQLCLRQLDPEGPALAGWRLQIAGCELPLREERDGADTVRLIGLRYRDYAPWRGLHPAIGPYGPLMFTLAHPAVDDALQATLHGWCPNGMPYQGLPDDLAKAAQRRGERLVTRRVPRRDVAAGDAPPAAALSDYTIDLRRIPPSGV